jgi:hypothetical protein
MGGTFDKVLRIGSSSKYDLRVWNVRDERVGTCTLLGPEGPDASSEATNLRTFSDAGSAGSGEGTARTLRTTQWTRASLS